MTKYGNPATASGAAAGSMARPDAKRIDERRARLDRFFEEVRSAHPSLLSETLREALEALEQKFRSDRFHLVFLGQFKRGKTSLLNSIVESDLLPTGVLPVTSIVTLVRFGPSLRARVRFANGEFREIPPDQLPSYVTERGNPRNEKGVREVEVLVPSPALRNNLCLVDTPGIGSIFEQNTRVAYDFVPKADAAVFVFSPEPSLSQAELEFLHHLRGHVDKIFFVLNKADQLTASEREEILDFARHALRRQLPEGELRLVTVSARQALEARLGKTESESAAACGLDTLLEAIGRFLADHRGDVLIRSTALGLRRLLSNELLSLELEERAAALPAAEVAKRMESIEKVWEKLERRHREVGPILRAEIRSLEDSLLAELKDFVEAEVHRLRQSMHARLGSCRSGGKREWVARMDNELRTTITEIFDDWKEREERAIRKAFEALTAWLSAEAVQAVEQIQNAAAEQFGFHWRAVALPDRLEARSTFTVEVDPLMMWGVGRFPLLLPRFLFVRYLAARLEGACSSELHRNAGRLRDDLGDRLEKSVGDFLKVLDRYVGEARDSVLTALRRAAALAGAAAEERSRVEQAVAGRVRFLKELDQQLAEFQLN